MSNCSKHKKSVGEYTDMKKLAEDIGDLHYETLAEFFVHLTEKFERDADKDYKAKRYKLATELYGAAEHTQHVGGFIGFAWEISEPYMKDDDNIS